MQPAHVSHSTKPNGVRDRDTGVACQPEFSQHLNHQNRCCARTAAGNSDGQPRAGWRMASSSANAAASFLISAYCDTKRSQANITATRLATRPELVVRPSGIGPSPAIVTYFRFE